MLMEKVNVSLYKITINVTLEELILKSLSRLLNFLLKILSKEFAPVRHVFNFDI